MSQEKYLFHKHEDVHPSETQAGNQKEWLGEGRRAQVHQTQLTVERNENERTVTLALKKYPYAKPFELERMQHVHSILKKHNIPVLTTFRIDVNENTIAMTDWTDGHKYVVGSVNTGSREEMRTIDTVSAINNFESFCIHLFEAAMQAARQKIRIHRDGYFFRCPRAGGDIELEFVIGDFDNVKEVTLEEPALSLLQQNITEACKSFRMWSRDNVPYELREELDSKLETMEKNI